MADIDQNARLAAWTNAIGELTNTREIADADLQEAQKDVEDHADSQYYRRAFARVLFTNIEAICFLLQQFARRMHSLLDSIGGGHVSGFSDGELALLEGKVYALSDIGEVQAFPIKGRFLGRLHFAFRIFAKAHATTFEFDKTSGWESLREALKIRHRVNHPTSADDLSVSLNELEVLTDAAEWYQRELSRLLTDTIETYKVSRSGDSYVVRIR